MCAYRKNWIRNFICLCNCSVIVTSISREDDTREECTEGSGFYSVPNKSPFSLLVPQNKALNSISEIQIHPNCTYRIQVHANPRAKPAGQLPEVRVCLITNMYVGKINLVDERRHIFRMFFITQVIYTVPECVERKCSCVAAKLNLPVPEVEVTQVEEDIIVNWNVTSYSSYIQSYVIRWNLFSLCLLHKLYSWLFSYLHKIFRFIYIILFLFLVLACHFWFQTRVILCTILPG